MSDIITCQALPGGIRTVSIRNGKFKSTRIVLEFKAPLREETVTEYALLPFLLSRSSGRFPDSASLNSELARLYGAALYSGVRKQSDELSLYLVVDALDDRFSLDGQSISDEAAELLASLIFEPNYKDGAFDPAVLENEKRLQIERIESEINEKRLYAINRCISLLCEGEPFGIPKYGTAERLRAITPQSEAEALKRLLREARVNITAIGESDPAAATDRFTEGLERLPRTAEESGRAGVRPARRTVREETDRMDVTQGKLVLGFRSGAPHTLRESAAFKVMADIFGGGPYSLLFSHVREALSLCYYCAARYYRQKGIILVDSGVESANASHAREEILRQFEVMKQGGFGEDVLEASRLAMVDAYRGVSDSMDTLQEWYSAQLEEDSFLSPEEYAALVSGVTKEDVVSAAREFALDTVYLLAPKEDKA